MSRGWRWWWVVVAPSCPLSSDLRVPNRSGHALLRCEGVHAREPDRNRRTSPSRWQASRPCDSVQSGASRPPPPPATDNSRNAIEAVTKRQTRATVPERNRSLAAPVGRRLRPGDDTRLRDHDGLTTVTVWYGVLVDDGGVGAPDSERLTSAWCDRPRASPRRQSSGRFARIRWRSGVR